MANFIQIALFVLLGMLFQRLKSFPKDTPQVLNMFAIYISMPALILLKAPQIALTSAALIPLLVPWGLLLLSVALVLSGARIFNWQRGVVGVLLLLVPLGNTSFIGIPMVQAFFGPQGLPHLIIYDQFGSFFVFSTYGSVILAMYGRERGLNLPAIVRRMILFPPTVALLVGLALHGRSYPPQLEQVLHNVSLTVIPLTMTAIGFQMRLRMQRGILGPLSFGLGVKLLLAPLAAFAVCRLLGFGGLPVEVSVIESAMPPMVTAGALAVIAGMDAELSVAMVSVGLVLCFGTIPLLYWILQLAH